ncbi:MAG: hypothetical protein RIQ94_2522 [Pseudomonadota bacterium]|jgi:hypothetical protein
MKTKFMLENLKEELDEITFSIKEEFEKNNSDKKKLEALVAVYDSILKDYWKLLLE